MKNKKSKIFILILLIAIAVGVGFGYRVYKKQQEEFRMELEYQYRTQNRCLLGYAAPSAQYEPFSTARQNHAYIYLYIYGKETKNLLSLNDVKEYLSSEFEEDGSVRIYTNGNWPEIEKYINWALSNQEKLNTSRDQALLQYSDLSKAYPELKNYQFHELSLHNLKEILHIMDDASYQPNFIFE